MAKLFAYALVWASGILLGQALPMTLIAKGVLAFCFAVALHALLLRWCAWMYRTSFGSWLQPRFSNRSAYKVGVVFLAVWYLLGVLESGGSITRVLVVEAAFFVGVWLTLHFREARSSLLDEICERF